jgi:squalene-hopene/tetraprenyl-beta-curcumene cyclase
VIKKNLLAAALMAAVLSLSVFCYAEKKRVSVLPQQGSTPNLSLILEAKHSLEIAHKYLLKTQLPNGSWINEPAVTSLVLYAFLLQPAYNPDAASESAINRGFQFLEQFVKPDGGIYRKEYRSYTTAVCLLAFVQSGQERYANIIKKAKKFLIDWQVDEGEGIPRNHPYYGGIGYGGDDRPDLSNTHLALEAIKAAEEYEQRFSKIVPGSRDQLEKEEKELGLHWTKALVFVTRCQNIKGVNDMPYATDDGGFIYETGHYKEERSHSYGSMTYAGVKSLVYAGLRKDDIRVKKAVSWIQDHYTLDENPGFGKVALYYYYMTFAKCLDALGDEAIVDSKGVKHRWREDVIHKLVSVQKEEGYWTSEDGQYWHNVKDLVTAYGCIAMKFALKGMGTGS